MGDGIHNYSNIVGYTSNERDKFVDDVKRLTKDMWEGIILLIQRYSPLELKYR